MNFAAFLDGLALVAGPDIQWLLAFFTAFGILLALYVPVLELVSWMKNKFRR